MSNLDIHKYKTIIFDLDGVLFDSNQIKGNNIYQATCEFVNTDEAKKFTAYFTGLNGIPRGVKINHFFSDNPDMASALLARYNQLNQESIYQAPQTPGAKDFLNFCKEKYTLFVLSGGAEQEIRKLLEQNHLTSFFRKIMGGPLNKSENLKKETFEHPVLYIGDSKVDFETAQKFNFDFVFMYGYTQFSEWQDFFADKNCFLTENLETLYKRYFFNKYFIN